MLASEGQLFKFSMRSRPIPAIAPQPAVADAQVSCVPPAMLPAHLRA
jgi:hypothetical protein